MGSLISLQTEIFKVINDVLFQKSIFTPLYLGFARQFQMQILSRGGK